MNHKSKIYVFVYRLYLSVFRHFIKQNTVRAKLNETVCTRYDLYRHKGKLAKVIDTGKLRFEENGKVKEERNCVCVTLKFKDGTTAWNFTPNEYHII